jgi:nucleotide-binding universal stress UspA family protein
MYKTILVHADARPESAGRIRCAAWLADRFDALLLGCGCEMPTPIPIGPFGDANGELILEMRTLATDDLIGAEAAFRTLAGQRKLAWVSMLALPDEAIPLAARQADLIVTARAPRGRVDASRNEDPGLLAVIAGRPVLVVPPDRDHLSGQRVVVGWKDSRESRRALSDAMPFLQRAADVLVVEVAHAPQLADAQMGVNEVTESLKRHGVNVSGEALLKDEQDVTTLLLDRTRAFGADLIVAGAYGRTRLGEWAFGGVTRNLLDQTEFFVLLSH